MMPVFKNIFVFKIRQHRNRMLYEYWHENIFCIELHMCAGIHVGIHIHMCIHIRRIPISFC